MNLPCYPQRLKGYMHIRKAHCMLARDCGPRLSDAGLWRDLYLVNADLPIINDVRILQNHNNEKFILIKEVWR